MQIGWCHMFYILFDTINIFFFSSFFKWSNPNSLYNFTVSVNLYVLN